MNINKVTTAIKVGDIVLRKTKSPDLIKPIWINPKDNILKSNAGRVYFIVVNGIIYKIGGSQSKDGIRQTIRGYTSCMKGSPSDRSYIIHYLIYQELIKNNKVEIYMITSPKVKAPVTGLYGSEIKDVAPFKEMESLCIEQHFESEQSHPIWNFQESHTQYPSDLVEQYSKFKVMKSEKNKK